MDRSRALCVAFLMSLTFATRASAETGYVFVGDFNQDGVEDRIDHLSPDRRMAMEPPVQALLGEVFKEADETVEIVAARRSQPHRRTVA